MRFHGDYVAMVVAQSTRRPCTRRVAAARRLRHRPSRSSTSTTRVPAARTDDPAGADSTRGDLERGLAEADVVVEADFVTGDNTNNPLGLFAACAEWDGDALHMWATTQWPSNTADCLAEAWGIAREDVRWSVPTWAAASAPDCALALHPRRRDGRQGRRPTGARGAEPPADVHRRRPPSRDRPARPPGRPPRRHPHRRRAHRDDPGRRRRRQPGERGLRHASGVRRRAPARRRRPGAAAHLAARLDACAR